MQSPCVAKCGLNEEDYCMGCYRHIDEIVGWSQSSVKEKKEICSQLQYRKKKYLGQENNGILSRDKWLAAESRIKNKA